MTGASRLNLKKIVESRAEAEGELCSPGDAVLIARGIPRWLLLACPCGCGAEIPINLDSRAGKAWRFYKHPTQGVSLYPSVWRDTDCEAHFIIWRDRIFVFGDDYEYLTSSSERSEFVELGTRVLATMRIGDSADYADLAEALDEIPWDVLQACRQLAREGSLKESKGSRRGIFTRLR